MQVAGIRRLGARVEMIEVGEPRPLAGDEVLLEVKAAGVASWDEFVRTGGWDVGARPPMALGVEAAGTVLAAGQAVGGWTPGNAVMTHPVPLRDQGTWAPRLIAPAGLLARKPPSATWEAAAAFPVPALTAEQVLGALNIHAGEQLLIHGTGGVTGGLLVALAVLRGAEVIATAGPASQQRVAELGARHIIDYGDVEQVLAGTLTEQARRCGRPGCRCADGEPHGPYAYFTPRPAGRGRARYVPAALAGVVRRYLRRGEQVQAVLAEISAINAELLARGELR